MVDGEGGIRTPGAFTLLFSRQPPSSTRPPLLIAGEYSILVAGLSRLAHGMGGFHRRGAETRRAAETKRAGTVERRDAEGKERAEKGTKKGTGS